MTTPDHKLALLAGIADMLDDAERRASVPARNPRVVSDGADAMAEWWTNNTIPITVDTVLAAAIIVDAQVTHGDSLADLSVVVASMCRRLLTGHYTPEPAEA